MARRRSFARSAPFLLVVAACSVEDDGGDLIIDPPGPPPTLTAPSAIDVRVDDITNFGDGRDLEIRFVSVGPLDRISSYRIVVVKDSAALRLTPSAAGVLPTQRTTTVAPTSGEVVRILDAGALDADGDTISPGVPYRAVVLSVPDGARATEASLSPPSAPVTLAETSYKITFVGNGGVLLEDDTMRVLIDALQRRSDGFFIDIPVSVRSQVEGGEGRFSRVRLALATHGHDDHFLPAAVSSFLDNVPAATFLGAPETTRNLSGHPRVGPMSVARGERRDTTVVGVRVGVLHLRHFDQFGSDFGGVQNYAYLIEVGGKKVLHLGDVDYGAANLQPFGLAAQGIDVVLIPTFNTLLSAANRDAILTHVAPAHVVALHFRSAQSASEAAQVRQLYPGATVFLTPLESIRR